MAKISLELEPFPVPTHVNIVMPAGKRQDGVKAAPSLALSELSDEALEALINEFAEAVMKAARPE